MYNFLPVQISCNFMADWIAIHQEFDTARDGTIGSNS